MQKRKKGFIIATAVLVGMLVVGGTTYGITRSKQLSDAQTSIKNEQQSLSSIKSSLGKMVNQSGYLTSYASVQKLNQFKNQVNQMKDSYGDFHIKKDDLKNEIKVAKIGKRDVLTKVIAIESKMKAQTNVNAMFVTKAIDGSKVTSQPIKRTLTIDQINKVKESLPSGEDNEWMKEVQGLTDDASSQVNQIAKAKQELGNLIKDGTVVATASRDGYNQAVADVGNIKNSDVKRDLLKKLEQVLQVVTANEAKAQAIAQGQQQAQSGGSSGGSGGTSSGGYTSSGGTSSSGGDSATSRSTDGSSSGAVSKPSSSGSSSSSGGSVSNSGTQTGSGQISGTGNTYETGSFDGSGIPWDSFN